MTTRGLLVRAALWVGLALGVNVAVSFVVGFSVGLGAGLHHHGAEPAVLPWWIGPMAGLGLQGTLLLGAWLGAREAGLGWRAVERPALLGLLVVGQLMTTVVWTLAVVSVVGSPSTALGGLLRRGVAGDATVLWSLVVLAGVMAPVCEELFFRGWLWTGLRGRWGAVPTGLATAVPWLLLHLGDGGWRRALILVPAAVLFSVGREVCGSVRASMAMHWANNGVAVAAVVLMALLHPT